ncbi:M20 family metallopeptidase [Cohnella sp. AR92]|uniref:M20 metallopeptidase family protein n=1 Tax=Cohnella sp. AR92 TaxID=648716 RepID=UPI000F8D1BFC|nr:amidohydrolase [Cohnella sp. AR92]RUS48739.1 amidohydrolase [Cohnella sp. AR92]
MNREDTMQSLHGEMIEWRRYLHRHPELSFKEHRTSDWIAEKLEAWGLQVRRGVAGTGIVARLEGGRPGRTIALRTDIDALAIQDEKTVEYASTVPGVMHACGHDGHMAEMLAVAYYYSQRKEETVGTRVFLFQPAEEVLPGGALGMIEDGALEGVDAIYGVHLWSPFPYGVIATRPGPFMASPDEFEIVVKGKGGHGGLPHQSVDAVVAGAHMVTAIQTIVSRNVDPLQSAVISVGRMQAGTANNVIAERCLLAGTVRSFNEETRMFVRNRLEEVVRYISDMHGTETSFQFVFGYPPVVNTDSEAERVLRVADSLGNAGEAKRVEPVMAGEDFSYYLQKVPGCYFFVGAGAADGSSYPHHHPKFDIDERAMLNAARMLIAVADDSAADLNS